jgi:hypothetical protein
MDDYFVCVIEVVPPNLRSESPTEKAVPRAESWFSGICKAHACGGDGDYGDGTIPFNKQSQSWTFGASFESGEYLPRLLTLEIDVLQSAVLRANDSLL